MPRLQTYFGTADFLRRALAIALPIMAQELLTTSFSLVDTLMIGKLGPNALAAVGYGAAWNNLINVLIFGLTSGAAIFFAQYWGAGDHPGIHQAYGLALTAALSISLAAMALTCFQPGVVLTLFTNDAAAAAEATPYLRFVGLTYPAMALSMVVGTLLRSTERVHIPLIGSIVGVGVNIFLNYSLIFGHFGFPRLGIAGAAIGSAVSGWVNLGLMLLLGWLSHTLAIAPLRALFSFKGAFVRRYFKLSFPVLVNEALWGFGTTALNMVYGHIGTDEFAALTAFRTIDAFAVTAFIAMSHATAAIVGKRVGAGQTEEAYREARSILCWTPIIGGVLGAALIFFRHPLAAVFSQPPEVAELITGLIVVVSLTYVIRYIPFIQIMGIFRAGGDAKTGAVLDFIGVWVISIPLALVCGLWLKWPFLWVYGAIVTLDVIVKTIPGTRYFFSRNWIRPVTGA